VKPDVSASGQAAVRIADATLREFDDFLGDQSCRWVVTNFQMQSVTGATKAADMVSMISGSKA
jgi:hypothetical protein